ncbi:MAG: SIS domain-containing protein [Spirochaetaceae bacterium]|nr:SIS domain-containing protein [Spirochaetaceae bacterium]
MKVFIDDLIDRYPLLKKSRTDIIKAAELLISSVGMGRKILICGNGGSSADADHIVGELMKGFIHNRPLSQEQKSALEKVDGEIGGQLGSLLQQAIPAISLSAHSALNTAFLNDVESSFIFAQQVLGLGRENDVLWGISTSGNSKNIIAAVVAAKAIGLKTLALTGEKESRLSELCDVCIRVKETETFKVQELHLPVYHTLCLILEGHFFGNSGY